MLQGEKVAAVTQGPWLGRDGFVAETAVQFDRVNAAIARLERDFEKSRQMLAEMMEEAGRMRRLQTFEESLQNSRDYKITDLQRSVRDLKARLDAIEGERSAFVGLTYKSFGAVDKKLIELGDLQTEIERSERSVRRNAALFAIAAAVSIVAVLTHAF